MIGKMTILGMLVAIIAAIPTASAHGWYGGHVSYSTYHGEGQYYQISASAYNTGYDDGRCDSMYCNGHGYDPSCPSQHSDTYCNNYFTGYNAGFESTRINENAQAGSIGGNDLAIKGDHNDVTINQQLSQDQQQNSDNNNDHNSGGHGQLPNCKAFCLGVQ